jgi:hypothetical protein
MPSYNTNLKTWGATGQEYPDNYNYVEGEQPVDAWDNFLTSTLINDIEHLIDVTNNELLARDGTVAMNSDLPLGGNNIDNVGSITDDSGNTVYDGGNSWVPADRIEQGAGTGLNADKVDGKDSSDLQGASISGYSDEINNRSQNTQYTNNDSVIRVVKVKTGEADHTGTGVGSGQVRIEAQVDGVEMLANNDYFYEGDSGTQGQFALGPVSVTLVVPPNSTYQINVINNGDFSFNNNDIMVWQESIPA